MDQGRAAAWPSVAGLTDLQPLGRGGFGTVYRAWQVSVGRAVALKVDSRVLVDDRDRRRFMREASTAGRLSGHAHIVAVYDAGLTPDGRPYLVMELCPGGSLADRVNRAGPLQPEEVRRIGVGIADALASAHAAGVLHRDVKPGNILIDAYGTAKLADFGLAAVLDASGDSSPTRDALTPAYASPEAFALSPPTPQGDVYALGATLYALLAGRPPRAPAWPPGSMEELMAALRAPVPPVAGVSAALHAVLVGALEAERDDRTPSAAALRDALSAVEVSGSPAPARVAGPARSPSTARGRVALVAALAAILVLAGAGILAREAPPGRPVGGDASPAVPLVASTPSASTPGASAALAAPAGFAGCEDPAGGAFCPTLPACWGGLVVVGGMQATARPMACDEPHYWETYAAGRLPDDAVGLPLDQLAARSEVARVCSQEVMLARTLEGADATGWRREVLPQQLRGQDDWLFHCVAGAAEGGELTDAAFRSG